MIAWAMMSGDSLLIKIGEEIHKTVRGADTVARFSGDEFIILLEDFNQVDDALDITERILQSIRQCC